MVVILSEGWLVLTTANHSGHMVVKNQWNGMVEWNTGMAYWNRLIYTKNLLINTWMSDEDYQQRCQFARRGIIRSLATIGYRLYFH